MDITALIQSVQTSLGSHLPTLLGAVGIGVVGWLIAIVVRAVTRRGLGALNLDQRVSGASGTQLPITSWVARGLYALVLVLTAIAVLNALNLGAASGPLAAMANDVLAFLPRLLAGLVLGAIAWLCAIAVRMLISRVAASRLLDARLSAASGSKSAVPMSTQLAQAGFWLTLLLFLPAVLGAFQLNGLLGPVQGMMATLLAAIPNVLAAVAIAAVGYMVAKLLRTIVDGLLDTAGANGLTSKLGLPGSLRLSALGGTVVYVMILLPTLIAALEALNIESISGPASAMLVQIFEAVPNIIAATIILALSYFVARIVANLATEFLAGVGADSLPEKLGLTKTASGLRISVIAGRVLMLFAMLFATMEAANRLGFARVSELASTFVRFSGDLLLGGFILVVGYWLANLAHDAISRATGASNPALARMARFAILGLVLAMGLRAMGIASDIVNLAFGLTLGAVAVAAALSFGLGGREAAGRQMEYWLSSWRSGSRVPDANAVPLPGDQPERAGIFASPSSKDSSGGPSAN